MDTSEFSRLCVKVFGNDSEAEYTIGEFYEYGLGKINVDLIGAIKYYTRAYIHTENEDLKDKYLKAIKRVQMKYDFKNF
jgi:hypothetical protein